MSVHYTELAKMLDHAQLMPSLAATEVDAAIRMTRARHTSEPKH